MAKVPQAKEEGSKRVLIFDARLERVGSGRGVSGLVSIQYGSWDEQMRSHVQTGLAAGRYKFVVQRKANQRWVHVSSEEVTIVLAPS